MDYKNSIQDNLFTHIQVFKLPPLSVSEPEITMRVRDIDFVISERKLEALDPSALSKFLEPLSSPSSSDDLKLSDDDLFDVCSNRYVQQASDVNDFANWLTDKAEVIKSKYKDKKEQKEFWDKFITNLKSSASPAPAKQE
jgi:hypothetical protein|nr:MAG TPA: hypothetical protein [Microviridae sp.]